MFTRRFIFVILLTIGFIPEAFGKYVVLDPTKSLSSQMTLSDCTYEIRDDFNLKGGTLVVPKNSTLVFKGGSISDCAITFNNTWLNGNVNICLRDPGLVKGGIANETICPRWFNVKDEELFLLLNALLPYNSHKTYCVEPLIYTITVPLVIRNVSDAVFDFRGATIIDQTQGESVLLHRPNPMIHIRTSHNIEIKNLVYQVSSKRYFSTIGTSAIWIGAGSNDWDKDCYNIRINNISGKGDLVRAVKGGTSANTLLGGIGNMHNIELSNVDYDGDVASLCNFEWGLLPADSGTYQKRGINIPANYGIHPFNITVKNVVGRNAPNSSGYIRFSSCYNVLVENCYGYNVNSLVMLYNGDMSIARVNGSAIVRNCASYINDEYKGKSLSGILIFNTYEDPVSSQKHSEDLYHNMSYIIENCEFQGLLGITGNGIRVLGGDGNVVFTNVTVKNYTLGAKLSGAAGHDKKGGLALNNCLFLNNSSSIELYSLDNCVFQSCIFRNNISHNKNKIGDSQVAVYSGVSGFSLRDCVFEDNSKYNKASFVTFEQKDNVKAQIENCSFIGSKSEAPIIIPKTVSLNDCKIN